MKPTVRSRRCSGSSGRGFIAALARLTRDVDRAEELAQEALLIALTEWPKSGVPR